MSQLLKKQDVLPFISGEYKRITGRKETTVSDAVWKLIYSNDKIVLAAIIEGAVPLFIIFSRINLKFAR